MPILGPSDAFSPREWGAAVDYDTWTDLYVPKDGVALHHGGGSDYTAAQPPYSTTKEAALLRSWEWFHLSKGWRGLAYGWGVGQSGAVYRIRGWGIYGAHRGDVDGDGIANNREIVPIIWIASGNHHTPTPEADASIQRLRAFVEHHAPAATRLWGHREIQAEFTECPGPNGMTYVNANRDLETSMLRPEVEQFVNDLYDRMKELYPNDKVPTAAGLSTYLIPDVRRNIVTMDELQDIVASSSNVDEVARKLAQANAAKLDRIKEAI